MLNRKFLYLAVFLALAVIGLYFRFLPARPKSDRQLKKYATGAVLKKIRAGVETRLDSAFPNLSASQRAAMIDKGYKEILNDNRRQIQGTIDALYGELKKSASDNIKNYFLIEADSYYYLGLMKNVIEKGRLSPSVKNGLYFNPLMMAPLGNLYYFDLHPYVGLTVYNIAKWFDKGISLENAAALVSPVLSIVILAALLLCLYAEGVSAQAAFIGVLFVTGAPIYFQRSLYGWFDTDPYNVLFPALIIFLSLRAFRPRPGSEGGSVEACLAGLATAAYTMFWSGWVYIMFSVLFFGIAASAYNAFERDMAAEKRLLKKLSIYLISAVLAILALRGPRGFMFSLGDTFSRLALFRKSGFNLWPDAFVTVGELKKIGFVKLTVLCGGRVLFASALAGIFLSLYARGKTAPEKIRERYNGLVLLSFTVIPFLMASGAERFTILLVAPLGYAFIFLIDRAVAAVSSVYGIITKGLLTAAIFSLTAIPLFSMTLMALRDQPVIYNESWDAAMKFMREKTPPGSIIDTWWPPGHFITGMGRRGAIFDGATLEKPVGYWISRIFMADSEEEALGLLRMINTSGNRATDFLLSRGFSLSVAVDTLAGITLLSQDAAREELRPLLSDADITGLLALTHGTGEPLPSYLFIYRDLAEESIAFQFMGRWDFRKAENFRAVKISDPKTAEKIIRQAAGNDMMRFLWGISGGPLYQEPESRAVMRSGNLVTFANGVSIDVGNMDVSYSGKDAKLKNFTGRLLYAEGKEVKEKIFRPGGKLTIMLIDRGSRYSITVVDNTLADSLLLRLYYFEGAGYKHFTLVDHVNNDPGNTDIYIFRVDWE